MGYGKFIQRFLIHPRERYTGNDSASCWDWNGTEQILVCLGPSMTAVQQKSCMCTASGVKGKVFSEVWWNYDVCVVR